MSDQYNRKKRQQSQGLSRGSLGLSGPKNKARLTVVSAPKPIDLPSLRKESAKGATASSSSLDKKDVKHTSVGEDTATSPLETNLSTPENVSRNTSVPDMSSSGARESAWSKRLNIPPSVPLNSNVVKPSPSQEHITSTRPSLASSSSKKDLSFITSTTDWVDTLDDEDDEVPLPIFQTGVDGVQVLNLSAEEDSPVPADNKTTDHHQQHQIEPSREKMSYSAVSAKGLQKEPFIHSENVDGKPWQRVDQQPSEQSYDRTSQDWRHEKLAHHSGERTGGHYYDRSDYDGGYDRRFSSRHDTFRDSTQPGGPGVGHLPLAPGWPGTNMKLEDFEKKDPRDGSRHDSGVREHRVERGDEEQWDSENFVNEDEKKLWSSENFPRQSQRHRSLWQPEHRSEHGRNHDDADGKPWRSGGNPRSRGRGGHQSSRYPRREREYEPGHGLESNSVIVLSREKERWTEPVHDSLPSDTPHPPSNDFPEEKTTSRLQSQMEAVEKERKPQPSEKNGSKKFTFSLFKRDNVSVEGLDKVMSNIKHMIDEGNHAVIAESEDTKMNGKVVNEETSNPEESFSSKNTVAISKTESTTIIAREPFDVPLPASLKEDLKLNFFPDENELEQHEATSSSATTVSSGQIPRAATPPATIEPLVVSQISGNVWGPPFHSTAQRTATSPFSSSSSPRHHEVNSSVWPSTSSWTPNKSMTPPQQPIPNTLMDPRNIQIRSLWGQDTPSQYGKNQNVSVATSVGVNPLPQIHSSLPVQRPPAPMMSIHPISLPQTGPYVPVVAPSVVYPRPPHLMHVHNIPGNGGSFPFVQSAPGLDYTQPAYMHRQYAYPPRISGTGMPPVMTPPTMMMDTLGTSKWHNVPADSSSFRPANTTVPTFKQGNVASTNPTTGQNVWGPNHLIKPVNPPEISLTTNQEDLVSPLSSPLPDPGLDLARSGTSSPSRNESGPTHSSQISSKRISKFQFSLKKTSSAKAVEKNKEVTKDSAPNPQKETVQKPVGAPVVIKLIKKTSFVKGSSSTWTESDEPRAAGPPKKALNISLIKRTSASSSSTSLNETSSPALQSQNTSFSSRPVKVLLHKRSHDHRKAD